MAAEIMPVLILDFLIFFSVGVCEKEWWKKNAGEGLLFLSIILSLGGALLARIEKEIC